MVEITEIRWYQFDRAIMSKVTKDVAQAFAEIIRLAAQLPCFLQDACPPSDTRGDGAESAGFGPPLLAFPYYHLFALWTMRVRGRLNKSD